MSIVIFAGPSLPPAVRSDDPRITWLPPVSQGDLLPVIGNGKVQVIGIIDGYFESVPAVLHKEILWALENGIRVIGGASMGALRAAELHALGMKGVGRVFEGFRDERLTDDDEVAVLHGPAEAGYLPLSDAMVDIRASAEAAVAAGVMEAGEAQRLVEESKRLFYKDRQLPEALRPFRIDVKRRDALCVVDAAVAALDEPAPSPSWSFGWTDAFDSVARSHHSAIAALDRFEQALLDELRLDPALYIDLRNQTLLRGLAVHGCDGAGEVAPAARTASRYEIYLDRGLWTGEAQRQWQEQNGLDEAAVERLAGHDAALEQLGSRPPDWFWRLLLDILRSSAHLGPLSARAEMKIAWLETEAAEGMVPADHGIHPVDLRRRYFEERLGRPAPDDVERWSRLVGFNGSEDFHRALLVDLLVCPQSE